VKILREADQSTVTEVARKHSVTEQTIYRWRRLYDGMQVNDVKELNGLLDENSRL
jgi:putative transposase